MKTFLKKYKFLLITIAAIGLFVTGFFAGRANQKVITKTVTKIVKKKTISDEVQNIEPYQSIKHTLDEYVKRDLDRLQKDNEVDKKINDLINYHIPVKTEVVRIPVPGKDSIIYKTEKVDTSEIISQFVTENKYRQTLFDNDSNGKLIVNTSVQFNQQKSIGYSFTPVYKIVTKTVEKKNTFTPFLSASYNTLNYGGVGGGVFIKNVGFEYKYLRGLMGQVAHEGGLKIKF